MLVLSRAPNEKILFPNLGVCVEVLQIRGNRVRIGIEAPPEVHIRREELANKDDQLPNASPLLRQTGGWSHRLRNRLHEANLALQLAQKQLNAGLHDDANQTLARAFSSFQKLDHEAASAPRATGRRNRALVVEDNNNECELLAGYLRLSGFDVETAHDGLQAMVRLSEDRAVDCVLLDMRMPRMDGPRTINSIRRNPNYRGIKIFAVSGTQPAELNLPLGSQGVDRWFAKPVDPQRLVDQIQQDLNDPCLTV